MKTLRVLSALLLAVLMSGFLIPGAWAEVAVPALTQRVTDLTATLDATQTRTLEARLADFEAQKGAQLAVLIVPTTQPDTIEQYGIRVVEAWKLGRKGVDDGALLLVAKDDHTLRIEVGYGLEGALNDATAHRIVDEVIVPRFKSGEFYSGIDSGVSAMMQVVNGESLPAPQRRSGGKQDTESLMFMGFVIAVALGGMLRAMLGRFPAALLVGSVLGGLAWLVVASSLIALLAGLAAFVFVLLGGGRGGLGGGGFGSGGGGFGGGGGGFGGGGASGRW